MKEIGCEIYIPDSKETFDLFYEHRNEINTAINNLDWMKLPTKKASKIKTKIKADFKVQDKWPEYFEWLGQTATQFQEIFHKY